MTGVASCEWLFQLAIILGNLITVARRQRDNTLPVVLFLKVGARWRGQA